MPNFKTIADLKGRKIGVTAPGSSTNVMVNFLLAKAGLTPADVSIVGVGARPCAWAGSSRPGVPVSNAAPASAEPWARKARRVDRSWVNAVSMLASQSRAGREIAPRIPPWPWPT